MMTRRRNHNSNSDSIIEVNQRVQQLELDFTSQLTQFKEELQTTQRSEGNKNYDDLLKKFEIFEQNVMDGIANIKEDLDKKFHDLEYIIDEGTQKVNNKVLLLHGLPESELSNKSEGNQNENNNDIYSLILKLLQTKCQTNIEKVDLSDCYRFGKKVINSKKPRPVVIEFAHKWKRDELFFKKRLLKGSQLILSEFLTKPRLYLFKECQKVSRQVWSINGNIFILQNGKRRLITSVQDLSSL